MNIINNYSDGFGDIETKFGQRVEEINLLPRYRFQLDRIVRCRAASYGIFVFLREVA
jgi:hypothetical protein